MAIQWDKEVDEIKAAIEKVDALCRKEFGSTFEAYGILLLLVGKYYELILHHDKNEKHKQDAPIMLMTVIKNLSNVSVVETNIDAFSDIGNKVPN